jgi:hypothetical protein
MPLHIDRNRILSPVGENVFEVDWRESVLSNSDDAVRHSVVIKTDDLNAGGLIVDSGTSATLLKVIGCFQAAWRRNG